MWAANKFDTIHGHGRNDNREQVEEGADDGERWHPKALFPTNETHGHTVTADPTTPNDHGRGRTIAHGNTGFFWRQYVVVDDDDGGGGVVVAVADVVMVALVRCCMLFVGSTWTV